MSWIEQKYITYLGNHLDKFKKTNQNTYNFRCPYCGDSRTDPNKARGYLFYAEGDWHYKCHNCGRSSNLIGLMKTTSLSLYNEYKMELFKLKNSDIIEREENLDFGLKLDEIKLDGVSLKLSNLPSNHQAITYFNNRKIPEKYKSELYYSDDLNILKKYFHRYDDVIFKKDSRLIIPIRNEASKIIAITARAINKVSSSERYVIMKIDTEEPLIYGLDKINRNEEINVVEGPIDSMFVDNCIAVSGSDLQKALNKLPKNKLNFIFDNQPRNREIINKMNKLIEDGCTITIWPKDLEPKDINEMVLKDFDFKNIIENSKYSGMSAKLKLSDWSRI